MERDAFLTGVRGKGHEQPENVRLRTSEDQD